MTANQSKDSLGSDLPDNNNIQRIFPPIKPDIYKSSYDLSNLTSDQKVALKLLDLSNRKFNKYEELLGWNLDAETKLSRLLNWHRLGIEKELEGQWKQADFYWKEVQLEIHKLAKQDNLWLSLAKEYAEEYSIVVMNDPVKMRQRLVDELLIDTHYTFYHSIDQQSGELERKEQSFRHIKYIEKLANLSSFSKNYLLTLLNHSWQKQINLYVESEKYTEAYLVCENRLSLFPDCIKFQNQLIEMRFKALMARLNNESSRNKLLKDIKYLNQEIIWYKKFLETHSNNLIIFQYIAFLYNLCAIKLNNSNQIARSFLYIEKALNYNPDFTQGYKLKQQIQIQIKQLQKNAQEIKKELFRRNKNELFSRRKTVISAGGKWIINEASIGFSLGNNYQKSSKFKDIADTYRIAKKNYPSLVQADISNSVIIPNTSQTASDFKPELSSVKVKNEPFLPWLFSHQDLRFKILPSFATLFLLFTGGFFLRESFATKVRSRTYQEIIEASEKYDSLKVIKNAEQFLAHKSVKGKDFREGEVQQLYAQALIQWLSQKEEELDNSDLKIISRYQRLNQNK